MPDSDAGKRRKGRNLAIGGGILTFVLIIYLVTILKIGAQIADRSF